MSTRWYPLYQKGNPQLRVFLPNFWLKLVKPVHKQPENVVQFHCSMEMTKYDIKSYIEKIYNVKTAHIRTRIALGKTKKNVVGYIVKEDDIKVAYVVLPKDESFQFPELFAKKSTVDKSEEAMNELRHNIKKYVGSNKTPGLVTWFKT